MIRVFSTVTLDCGQSHCDLEEWREVVKLHGCSFTSEKIENDIDLDSAVINRHQSFTPTPTLERIRKVSDDRTSKKSCKMLTPSFAIGGASFGLVRL